MPIKTICFATNNTNKLREIQAILGEQFDVKSLTDIGCKEELPETQLTLEGNSRQKAAFVLKNYGVSCFADDTGLEVEALNGEPGVFSARYAGEQRNNEDNIDLLLNKLENRDNRKAQFRTVVTFISEHEDKQFEGIVKGKIIKEREGVAGFGYDPVFMPEGYTTTFAQMDLNDKNKISHRGRAIKKLVDFLLAGEN